MMINIMTTMSIAQTLIVSKQSYLCFENCDVILGRTNTFIPSVVSHWATLNRINVSREIQYTGGYYGGKVSVFKDIWVGFTYYYRKEGLVCSGVKGRESQRNNRHMRKQFFFSSKLPEDTKIINNIYFQLQKKSELVYRSPASKNFLASTQIAQFPIDFSQ